MNEKRKKRKKRRKRKKRKKKRKKMLMIERREINYLISGDADAVERTLRCEFHSI